MSQNLCRSFLLYIFVIVSISFSRGVPQRFLADSSAYKPYICPYTNPQWAVCDTGTKDSCVCYSDGTCKNIQANKCSTCLNDDVVSVNEDSTCASRILYGDWVRCETSKPPTQDCPSGTVDGCTCYKSGTCSAGLVNSCEKCRDSTVALVILNGDCPSNGITTIPSDYH